MLLYFHVITESFTLMEIRVSVLMMAFAIIYFHLIVGKVFKKYYYYYYYHYYYYYYHHHRHHY